MTKTTRKGLSLLLALAAPVLFAGCLKCDLLLNINKDGSGSIEATYSIAENAVAQLNSMVKLGNQLDQISTTAGSPVLKNPEMLLFLDPNEETIRKRIAKYKEFGLELEKLRITSRNGRRNVDIRVEFKNIAEVAKADFFSDIGFSFYRRQTGDFIFFRKSINADNPDKDVLSDESAQRMIAPILEGFEVNVKIQPPGRVLESNGSKSASAVTWRFNQDNDPKAFQKLQNQEYIILVDGTDIRIPDIKIVKKSDIPAK